MVLSNFITTYQRDYSGVKSKAFRVQSARAHTGASLHALGNKIPNNRPVTRSGHEVNIYNRVVKRQAVRKNRNHVIKKTKM